MPTVKLGISLSIDYAHSLPGHKKCGVLHGHTARVTVVVRGSIPMDGKECGNYMLIDFIELRDRVKNILMELDHRNLNELFICPTAEVLAYWIYRKLREVLPSNIEIVSVRVQEGDSGWAEYEGE